MYSSTSEDTTSPGTHRYDQRTPSSRRRPIPRKGHTKSRLGCTICKRRKVKCDEATPECGPCQRLGLECLFVQRGEQEVPEVRATPPLSLAKTMSSTPPSFGMDDLRFFSHFLFAAYPPLPIGGRKVWQQMSQMSHEYEFLMHSMLGLGASNLSLITADGFAQSALRHRVTAIEGVNKFLSRKTFTTAHADAAFATILALTYQSSHMPDGLVDFLTMVRGCHLVGNSIVYMHEQSEFVSFTKNAYINQLLKLVTTEYRCLDPIIADAFSASTDRLAPLCHAVAEVGFLATMNRTSSSAAYDPTESHEQHTTLYGKLGEMTPEEFTWFIDPGNSVGRLLIIHMLILDVIMSRRVVEEQGPGTILNCCKSTAVLWIEKVVKELPKEYVKYAEWPLSFGRSLDFSINMEDAIWKPLLLEDRSTDLGRMSIVEIGI